jgi:hypothetical protein
MSVPERPTATPETKKMTPEEIELEWYRTTYQGDNMPRLTLRDPQDTRRRKETRLHCPLNRITLAQNVVKAYPTGR